MKGFEVQADAAATSADRIGANSSVATTGVAELATATATWTKGQSLATLSTAELDAMIAGEVVAMGTAATATEAAAVSAGAYGSVLFATAETEVVATAATVGFGAAVTGAIATIGAVVAAIAPWLIALGIAIELLKNYIEAQGQAALASETAAAKQDTINKALSQGAPAGISYAEAIKFVNEEERHRIAMNPAAAAQAYINKLSEQAKAAMRAAAEEAALNEGLAALGLTQKQQVDVQKLMTDARKASAKATKDTAKEDQEYFDAVVKLSNQLYDIENQMRDNIFLMGDMARLGHQASDGVNELFKAEDALQKKLAEIERQGIPAVFTQTDLTKVSPVSPAPKDIEEADGAIKKMHDDLAAVEQVLGGINSEWADMAVVATRTIDAVATKLAEGDWVGAIVAGVAGVGQIIGNAFRDEQWEHVNDMRDAFVDAAGGLAELNQQAHEVGLTLDTFLHAKTVEDYTAAVKELQAAFDHLAKLQAGVAKFGPTKDQIAETAKFAEEVFTEMRRLQDLGQVTQEQVNAAYLDYMRAIAAAGDEMAKAWVKAHDAATEGAKAVNAEMQKLIDRRDELTKAISQEAPEAERGVIELAMIAERDRVDQQIKDSRRAAEAAAQAQGDAADVTQEKWGDTSKVLRDELSAAADDAAAHMKEAFGFTLHIPIVFDNPGLPVVPMASGGSGVVSKPTLFLAGERGPEPYAFGNAARSGGGDDQTLPAILDALARLPRAISRSVKDSLVGMNG